MPVSTAKRKDSFSQDHEHDRAVVLNKCGQRSRFGSWLRRRGREQAHSYVNHDGQTIGYVEDVVLAKAGQPSDQTIGDDPSSSWITAKGRHNKIERKFRKINVPSKVLDEPISEGVHVILVGGKPGSGVRTTAMQERLALKRIACERVEDCEYTALTGPCLFCRKKGWDDGCMDAPQALQIDLFYKEVDRSIRRVAESSFYLASGCRTSHCRRALRDERPTTHCRVHGLDMAGAGREELHPASP